LPWRLAAASAWRQARLPMSNGGPWALHAQFDSDFPVLGGIQSTSRPQPGLSSRPGPSQQSTAAAESQRLPISRCGAAWEETLHCRDPQASVNSLPWLRRWTRGTSTSRRGWVACRGKLHCTPCPAEPHAQALRTPNRPLQLAETYADVTTEGAEVAVG
jgi:hypothetical protein